MVPDGPSDNRSWELQYRNDRLGNEINEDLPKIAI